MYRILLYIEVFVVVFVAFFVMGDRCVVYEGMFSLIGALCGDELLLYQDRRLLSVYAEQFRKCLIYEMGRLM